MTAGRSRAEARAKVARDAYQQYMRDRWNCPNVTVKLDLRDRRIGDLTEPQIYRAANQAAEQASHDCLVRQQRGEWT